MTVRTLFLLRHAKAESPPATADVDRPLSARGRSDAASAGSWLTDQPAPELVLCSPAKRTRQTWHEVAPGLPATATPTVRYEPALYEGDMERALELLRALTDTATAVLVVGHNPSLSQLSATLAEGADSPAALDSDGLHTSGLAVHTLSGQWSECGPGAAPLVAVHTARGAHQGR